MQPGSLDAGSHYMPIYYMVCTLFFCFLSCTKLHLLTQFFCLLPCLANLSHPNLSWAEVFVLAHPYLFSPSFIEENLFPRCPFSPDLNCKSIQFFFRELDMSLVSSFLLFSLYSFFLLFPTLPTMICCAKIVVWKWYCAKMAVWRYCAKIILYRKSGTEIKRKI